MTVRARRSTAERRVLGAIETARLAVPSYAEGSPLTEHEVERLLQVFNVEMYRVRLSVPAAIHPPMDGRYQLYVSNRTPWVARRFLCLHELGHVLTGDVEEPTIMQFSGPLPECEEVSDLFALSGLLDPADCYEGPEWVERRIWQVAPIDDRGWREHRIPRLAPQLIRLRERIDHWL